MMEAEARGGLEAGGVTPLFTGFNLNFACFNVKCNYRF